MTKFRHYHYLPVVLAGALLFLLGCAAGDVTRFNVSSPAGFLAGLWHGAIAIITFIISLFSKNVRMYECLNNGGWYDFGFVLGFLIVYGGGSASTCRRSSRKRKCREE